jgi:hypothetical protein
VRLEKQVDQEYLMAWYTFSAKSRLEDSSQLKNTLVDSNTPVSYQSDCQWVGAQCAVFGYFGLQNYFTLPNLNLGQMSAISGFSICLWLVFEDFDVIHSYNRVFDFGLGAHDNNLLLARLGSSDTLSLFYNYLPNTNNEQIDSPNPIVQGTWRHFCVTNKNTDTGRSLWSIYENGVLSTQTTRDPVLTSITLTSNFIGKSNWNADPAFQGKIDDLRIYSKALSAGSITALYGYQGCAQKLHTKPFHTSSGQHLNQSEEAAGQEFEIAKYVTDNCFSFFFLYLYRGFVMHALHCWNIFKLGRFLTICEKKIQ